MHSPAKINLFLHITGTRADGYHAMQSLVTFATIGDEITYTASNHPLTLDYSGPFASELPPAHENHMMRYIARLHAQGLVPFTGQLHLVKNLPCSSGLGGGTGDGIAAIRAMAHHYGITLSDSRIMRHLPYSDMAPMLYGKPCLMEGKGDAITPVRLPGFAMVLVNPGAAVSTASVFAQITPPYREPIRLDIPLTDSAAWARWLATHTGNDLMDAAIALAPSIRTVCTALTSCAEVQLVRMTGSGSSCFGIFPSRGSADSAAALLQHAHPDWWVRSVLSPRSTLAR